MSMNTVTLRHVSRSQSTSDSRRRFGHGTALKEPSSSSTISRRRPSADEPEYLSWDEYLNMRKSRTSWEKRLTIPIVLIGIALEVWHQGRRGEKHTSKSIYNFLESGTPPYFAVGALVGGFLVGPFIGTSIWRYTVRHRPMHLIKQRDREFYRHIVKNRVDPAMRTATSGPPPDFYGENIGSLREYRQWLRDQSKFRKEAYLPEK
ncbi:mitochondrial import protein Pam17 [Panus rudis PR-1116 ss-1]|nr:mitochondrial import protein Pam17 [Panus rudis PR-1116 ss-1]